MSTRQASAAQPVKQHTQKRAPSAHEGSRWAGYFLVVVGTLLLTVAIEDALRASLVSGGGGGDVLRGTGGQERLVGFGGADDAWALAGEDELYGGDGDDELYGGEGRDVILGGAGDDFIEAKDGEADLVGCGSGADIASVDFDDRIARDCETIYPG